MAAPWFEEFFQGLALELWRKAKTPEKTRDEADFLSAVLGAGNGGHLLDVPCGNGRLAFALAERGFRTTGIDLSAEFITEAKQREGPAEMAWERGDMRHLDWKETFDGAYCFGNSFGFFPREDTHAFLTAVQRALKPGSRFVIDTSTAAETLLPGLEERSWNAIGEMLMLVEQHYEISASRLDSEYTFIYRGNRESRLAQYYIFTVAEIVRMLEECKLETVSLFSSLDQKPFTFGAPRLLLVAEKH